MNSKDVKKIMSELCQLISTVNYIPWMEGDLGFKFISKDGNYTAEFEDDEFHYHIKTFTPDLEWELCDVTLEDLDEKGVSWQFTSELVDRCEETILEIRDHINAHESDIEYFERVVNMIAGEPVLSYM